MDLKQLRRQVELEIDNYVYEYPAGSVGRPWSAEKVKAHLDEFRFALIDPYWANVVRRDTIDQGHSSIPPETECAVVANDRKGTLLAFDPTAAEFLLVKQMENRFVSVGVSGDAVGCFMAR
jgi:hypothetical protein